MAKSALDPQALAMLQAELLYMSADMGGGVLTRMIDFLEALNHSPPGIRPPLDAGLMCFYDTSPRVGLDA